MALCQSVGKLFVKKGKTFRNIDNRVLEIELVSSGKNMKKQTKQTPSLNCFVCPILRSKLKKKHYSNVVLYERDIVLIRDSSTI